VYATGLTSTILLPKVNLVPPTSLTISIFPSSKFRLSVAVNIVQVAIMTETFSVVKRNFTFFVVMVNMHPIIDITFKRTEAIAHFATSFGATPQLRSYFG
jgi:hypothetical protein